ncbi:TPA: ead/Ea22-like family protein [Escherichia coli]|uniref:ead/Ea22-like family protein n=1 Tax=Escherichia coli TaxID=562 RepID=UPI001750A0D6|nr:ead/Ea22-like family protein [Escherichia coli]EJA1176683.1 ead/Ea22-like family protein [Escherichia coli]EJK1457865.1 ead/Ea22-like family protein [Escherichia coli]ELE3010738.1 ead/Ea22-like family protein [Escherichia coli]MBB7900702.1 ead/Ea22-like family protein [Escherichia coli]MBB8767618.1 ead/Ea22-like family protein [Escherichia coli]
MSEINYQALRELAKQATQGEWVAFISPGTGTYAVHTPGDKRCEDVIKWPGFDGQKKAAANARYIAAFNPEVVQALLDELETAKKRIAELEKIATDYALKFQKAQDALKYAALLHSRTAQQTNNFAVLLPDISEYFINNVFQPLRYERDVERAIIKAGGKALWQEKHEERTHQLSDVNSGWLCPLTEGKKNT